MENTVVSTEIRTLKKKILKKTKLPPLKKKLKNRKRSQRRKRGKLRLLQYKKQLRIEHSQKTISALEPFKIPAMSATQAPLSSYHLPEVSQWHQKHEIAYWKSRAISLEYENKMLLEHIKKMHTKRIEEYLQCIEQPVDEENEEEEGEFDESEYTATDMDSSCVYEENCEDQSESDLTKPPEKDYCVDKEQEMKRLYGDKAATIIGMETALQLNFDKNMDVHKPIVWPNLPFKP